jgi:hypothetical protein
MPLQATSGAASYDAFGGGVPVVPNYIEDVFSTYLYTGNGPSSQTITNGIDLAGKGGLVWTKARTQPFALNNSLIDTVRGNRFQIYSDLTNAQADLGATVTNQAISSFNSNGFTLGGDQSSGCANYSSSATYASWTFRKQPKFFDVVTYSGNDVDARSISHNLGSVPGMIIVKRTDSSDDWYIWHRSINSNTGNGVIKFTTAAATVPDNGDIWGRAGGTPAYIAPTSTSFTVSSAYRVNSSLGTYVAYIFAHDAGGFGLTGTDNVISCGSFTTDGSGNASVNLGYEPQWVLIKRTDGAQNWLLNDVMRGMSLGQTSSNVLFPNLSNAEYTAWSASPVLPNATGFVANGSGSGGFSASADFIYIAIRRGPMKVPTSGTSVYNAIARTGTGATANVTGVGFAPDAVWGRRKDANYGRNFDRLRGANTSLAFAATLNEASPSDSLTSYNMDGFSVGADPSEHINASSIPYIYWNFKRAPSFMDEVCYTGTGSATTITHNLAAVPELMIVKRRSYVSPAVGWNVYSSSLANSEYLVLNSTAAKDTGTDRWNSTTPTSSVFSVGTSTTTNASAGTYIAYLFATCAGVSKVGSYTGTAATLQIDCGFTAGARFVLIKRTDSTGDWYVWDSVRGIVSGNDPYLLLNNTDAEVTNTDYIDTYSAGFEISSTAPAAINASGGSFLFLAIA